MLSAHVKMLQLLGDKVSGTLTGWGKAHLFSVAYDA